MVTVCRFFVVQYGGRLFTPQNMAQLMVFFAAQQNARKDIVNFAAIGIGKTNHDFGEKVRVEVIIDMLFPVRRRVKQLGAAAFFKPYYLPGRAIQLAR